MLLKTLFNYCTTNNMIGNKFFIIKLINKNKVKYYNLLI